ncbi:hypothetical protein [Pedobacter miscanthi]|uniref:hypothetical protein n=1 Tax=Pedobacter miscanthi TaxID=2259170 RepID=UPI00292E49EE|nr:hypothetical protein [Pedobacter miscanthi]
MSYAPIVLFIYNRPRHTQLTLIALASNELAKRSDLYIYADGPKPKAGAADQEKISAVRLLAANAKGFKSVTVFERETNLGLANSIFSGVTEIISIKGKAIILEDDLITSPYFLEYMNEGLALFEADKQVGSINAHAELFLKSHKFPEYFLLDGADCWGWATWKDRWEGFTLDPKLIKDELFKTNKLKEFEYGPHLNLLNLQIAKKIDTWDVQWHGFNVLKHRKGIFPKYSFIENIGLDGSGTHGDMTNKVFEVDSDALNQYKFKLTDWNKHKAEKELIWAQKKYKKIYKKKHVSSLSKKLMNLATNKLRKLIKMIRKL